MRSPRASNAQDGYRQLDIMQVTNALESVRAFAGPDIAKAVFYPEDEAFLVQRDLVADHWQVDEAVLAGGPGRPLRRIR